MYLHFPGCSYIIVEVTGCGSVWLERYLREVEAACSNHVTPTDRIPENLAMQGFPGFFVWKGSYVDHTKHIFAQEEKWYIMNTIR